MQFIICDFISKDAIYYIRFCIEMRYIISDVLSNCDLLYPILYQNVISYMRFCIKIQFIVYDFVSTCDLLHAVLY